MSIVRDVLMWVFFSVPVGLVVAALVAMVFGVLAVALARFG